MPLDEFPRENEGHPVAASTLTITNTGDGLSKPLRLQPVAWVVGEEVVVVLRGTIEKQGHAHDEKAEKDYVALGNKLLDDQVVLSRTHSLKTTGIAIVPEAKVKAVSGILSAAQKETERIEADRQKELDRLAAEEAEREAREIEEAAGVQRLTDYDPDEIEVDPDEVPEGDPE